MAGEIEQKFLVSGKDNLSGIAVPIIQGYLSMDPERVVRIRLAGDLG